MHVSISKKNIIFIIYGFLLLLIASPYSNPETYRTIENYLPYVNLMLILVGLLSGLFHNYYRDMLFVVLTSLFFLLIHYINGTSFGSIAGFISLICAVLYLRKGCVVDEIISIFSFYGMVYLSMSFFHSNTFYISFLSGNKQINPNTICLMISFFSIFINMKNFRFKYLTFFYNIVALYTIFKYRSRTVLVAFIIYLFMLYFVPRKVWYSKRTVLIIISLLFLFAFIFPIFYINAPDVLVHLFEKITGKSFYSGREIIWERFFSDLRNVKNLLWGPGSGMENKYTTLTIWGFVKVFSMHNSFLNIVLDFGLFGLLFLYIFIIKHVSDMHTKYISEKKVRSLLGLMMILIIGNAEDVFTYCYYIIFIALIITAMLQEELPILHNNM